jgi:hypothetical protein
MFYAITRMDYLDATALSLEAARQRSILMPLPAGESPGAGTPKPLRFCDS